MATYNGDEYLDRCIALLKSGSVKVRTVERYSGTVDVTKAGDRNRSYLPTGEEIMTIHFTRTDVRDRTQLALEARYGKKES